MTAGTTVMPGAAAWVRARLAAPRPAWLASAALFVVVGLAYAAGSQMAFHWFGAAVSPVFFPSAGVTVAALALAPFARWPAVLAGAGTAELVVDLSQGTGAALTLGFVAANLGEATVAALALRAVAPRPDLSRRRDLLAFLGLAVVAAPAVGGAIGATTMALFADLDGWATYAGRWWLGDGLGILIVGGGILAVRSARPAGRRAAAWWAEALLLVAAVAAATVAMFWLEELRWAYLPAVVLPWIALRLDTRGVALAGAAISFIAAHAVAGGHDLWTQLDVAPRTGLVYLQLLIAIGVSTALMLAAEVRERDQALREREGAEQARRRAEAEAALEAGLAGATTADEVARVLAAHAREVRGLRRAAVALVQGGRLVTAAAAPPEAARPPLPVDGDDPWCRAVREGREVPDGAGAAVMPLRAAGRVAGVLAVAWDASCGPAPTAALAREGARALERALLFQAERRAREDSERREQDLRGRDEQLRLVHATAGMGSWEWDPVTRSGSMAAETRRLLGVGPEEPEPMALVRRRVHPGDLVAGDARIARCIASGRPGATEFRYAHPVRGELWIRAEFARIPGEGRVVGLSVDVTERRRAEDRRRLLADVLEALEGVRGLRPRLARLPGLLVPRLADGARVERPLPGGGAEVVARAGRDDVPGEPGTDGARLTGDGTGMVVALRADGGPIGTLRLVMDPAGRRFTADDLASGAELGRRVGLVMERARLAEREREIAVELQLGLLGDSRGVPAAVDVASRYLPAERGLKVGGDWHDAVALPGGRLAVLVGDVVGHDLGAAVTMGQLRSGARALAPEAAGPADLLERIERFAEGVAGAEMATVACAIVDPAAGTLRYACAGHPPPVVIDREGVVRELAGGRSRPLCIGPAGAPRPEAGDVLPPGATLVLYTDGLIERRDEDIAASLARLRAALPGLRGMPAQELCTHLVRAMLGGAAPEDDVAVLAVRMPAPAPTFARRIAPEPDAVADLRHAARSWLLDAGVGRGDAEDLVLALSEAAGNAVEHAGTDEVHVEMGRHDGDLVISVHDRGRWRPGGPDADRGRGLGIIRRLVDDLQVVPGDEGTSVVMRLSQPPPAPAGMRGPEGRPQR